MALTIAILEDNADRRAAMSRILQDRFPQYPIRYFVTAAEMIAFLREHLPDLLAIGLDHDLELVRVTGGRCLDPGTGRDVAEFLASQSPVCPILIATTNWTAGEAMETLLRQAEWPVARVTPHDDLDWLTETWFPTFRRLVVSAVPHVRTATASLPTLACENL